MRHLIYNPQPNATPDEVMQVLKVFTFSSLPPQMQSEELLFKIYETLPKDAQRHFKIEEK